MGEKNPGETNFDETVAGSFSVAGRSLTTIFLLRSFCQDHFAKISGRGGTHGKSEGTGVDRLAAESGTNESGQPTKAR